MSKLIDAQHSIGRIIKPEEESGRDAVHFALFPAVAGQDLTRANVVYMEGGVAHCFNPARKSVGIVDPFLMHGVKKGEKFWVFLFPNTISGLRHVWSHPDFPEVGAEGLTKEKPSKNKTLEEQCVEQAIAWMKNHADKNTHLSYVALMNAADDYLETGEYYHLGQDTTGYECTDEFWDNYEIIRGVKVKPDDRGHFFSCSC